MAADVKTIGQEILERQLGPREKVPVGAAFAIAAAEIRQRIENGESVRTDGFFDEKQTGRSDAEEVGENVLLKVQREPEEKKIQYMGYLLANIAFIRKSAYTWPINSRRPLNNLPTGNYVY